VSSIQSQFLDLTAHHSRYKAIDPKSALKDSAREKVIFITGASRGIGQATAVAFAEASASAVYLTARSEDALEETRALVRRANPETQCACSICDVTSAAAVEAAVGDCVARFGGIDAADANAGYLGPWVKIGESNPESWWRNWEVNVRGAYHVIRFTLPHLAQSAKRRAAEGRSGGHLILISSVGAQLLMPGASDYQTSKHAINRLCEFVQVDYDTTASSASPSILAAFRPNSGGTCRKRCMPISSTIPSCPPASPYGFARGRLTGPRADI